EFETVNSSQPIPAIKAEDRIKRPEADPRHPLPDSARQAVLQPCWCWCPNGALKGFLSAARWVASGLDNGDHGADPAGRQRCAPGQTSPALGPATAADNGS